MRLELSVLPEGLETASSKADLIKIVDASGIHYQLTNEGTILEGSWDEVMNVAKQCRNEALKKTAKVTTIMHADDCAGGPQCTCKTPSRTTPTPSIPQFDDDGDWGII